MKKVNWGILSTAKIGREKVIPAMQRGQFSHISAIASRSLDKAQQVALDLGIAKAYGTYEELFTDPDIEGHLQPAAQRPARGHHTGGGARRQTCAVRKTVLDERRRGRAVARSSRQGPHHGGLHGAFPPAMAARPRIGAQWRFG
jgi:hypothetical protein